MDALNNNPKFSQNGFQGPSGSTTYDGTTSLAYDMRSTGHVHKIIMPTTAFSNLQLFMPFVTNLGAGRIFFFYVVPGNNNGATATFVAQATDGINQTPTPDATFVLNDTGAVQFGIVFGNQTSWKIAFFPVNFNPGLSNLPTWVYSTLHYTFVASGTIGADSNTGTFVVKPDQGSLSFNNGGLISLLAADDSGDGYHLDPAAHDGWYRVSISGSMVVNGDGNIGGLPPAISLQAGEDQAGAGGPIFGLVVAPPSHAAWTTGTASVAPTPDANGNYVVQISGSQIIQLYRGFTFKTEIPLQLVNQATQYGNGSVQNVQAVTMTFEYLNPLILVD